MFADSIIKITGQLKWGDVYMARVDKINLNEHQSLKIEIYQSGYAWCDYTWETAPYVIPNTHIYFIKEGIGHVVIDGKDNLLLGGNVYLIPRGTEFYYYCGKDEKFEKIYFHISLLDNTKQDLFQSAPKKMFSLPIESVTSADIFGMSLKNEYKDVMQLTSVIYDTVTAFWQSGILGDIPVKKYSEKVNRIMRYIQQNFRVNMDFDEVSQKLFISKATLHRIFKEETGLTPVQYANELIFDRAKRMLLYERCSIKEVVSQLGFCDQFHFSKMFKKRFGRAPSKYVKHILKLDD